MHDDELVKSAIISITDAIDCLEKVKSYKGLSEYLANRLFNLKDEIKDLKKEN